MVFRSLYSIRSVFILTLCVACDPGDPETPTSDPVADVINVFAPRENNCRLKRIVNDNGQTTEFSYDDLGRIVRIKYSDFHDYHFFYNANNEADSIQYSGEGTYARITWSDGVPVQQKQFLGDELNMTYNYTFSATKTIAEMETRKPLYAGDKTRFEFDSNGNLTDMTADGGWITYSRYDQKRNLLRLCGVAFFLPYAPTLDNYFSMNNPTEYTLISEKRTIKYTYNKKGYPIQKEEKAPVVTHVTTYEYENCE